MFIRHTYRLWIIAIIVLTAAVSAVLAISSVKAAPQVITLTPTSLNRIMQPGDTYNGSFNILNQGESSYEFHVYATPYSVKGEEYTPDFTPLPNRPNIASWFAFSKTTVYIEPGQTVTVDYTINMPKDTPPGGYYAAAFAETKLPPTDNSIVLNQRVGKIFYLQAAGDIAKKGDLLTWQSNFFQSPPLTSVLRLENSGGVHYPATINYHVQDVFGRDKYKLETVKEILPQTIRKVTIPWDKTPALGLFKVKGTVSFLDQEQTLSTKWVLVMSQTVKIILLVILATIVLLIILRKVYKRRAAKKPKNKK